MTLTPETVVRLLSNVPFSINQEHVRDFSNSTEQTNYFTAKTKQVYSQFTYQREEKAVKVPTNIDELYDINYLMYQNSNYSTKWFYAFVTRKEYVNPNTTAIYFELDVYQSWLFELSWKPSYIEREHTKRWNPDGSPIPNTVDEGLDYGTDYETASLVRYKPYNDVYFLVIVSKERMDSNIIGGNKVTPNINALPQPLTYYVHPFKLDGTQPLIMLAGEGATLSPVTEVLSELYANETAVNNIVSIYVTEYCGLDMTYDPQYNEWSLDRDHVEVAVIGTKHSLHVWNLPTYSNIKMTFPDVYADLSHNGESKLLMHPYTVLILDDFKGNRIELKNEYLSNNELKVMVLGSLGTSNKVAYTVTNYINSVPMENAVVNNNPNDIPILTEHLSAFLQGNRNQLENQVNSQMFSSIGGLIASMRGGDGCDGCVGR